jgi:hypothetical protein
MDGTQVLDGVVTFHGGERPVAEGKGREPAEEIGYRRVECIDVDKALAVDRAAAKIESQVATSRD